MIGKDKKKFEIIDVDIGFSIEDDHKLEEDLMKNIGGIIEDVKTKNRDVIDEVIDRLGSSIMTRDELSAMTNASGSKLSGVVTKLKNRLKREGKELIIDKKKKQYKLKAK